MVEGRVAHLHLAHDSQEGGGERGEQEEGERKERNRGKKRGEEKKRTQDSLQEQTPETIPFDQASLHICPLMKSVTQGF